MSTLNFNCSRLSSRLTLGGSAFGINLIPRDIWPRRLAGGGDEGNRTPDPLLAKQVLSQLSYTPKCTVYDGRHLSVSSTVQ